MKSIKIHIPLESYEFIEIEQDYSNEKELADITKDMFSRRKHIKDLYNASIPENQEEGAEYESGNIKWKKINGKWEYEKLPE